MTDRALLLAAGIFAASTAFGAAVSVKEDVRGAPLGVEVPGSVGMLLAAGWGSGLTALWPMPALALGAALFADPEARWARPTFEGIGIATLVGTAIEPVSWGRRGRSPLIAAAVSFNLLSAISLIRTGAGRRTMRWARGRVDRDSLIRRAVAAADTSQFGHGRPRFLKTRSCPRGGECGQDRRAAPWRKRHNSETKRLKPDRATP